MSMENGWRYYNHAMIPMCAPHECTEEAPLRNGAIWTMAMGGHLFLHGGQLTMTVDMKQAGGIVLRMNRLILKR